MHGRSNLLGQASGLTPAHGYKCWEARPLPGPSKPEPPKDFQSQALSGPFSLPKTSHSGSQSCIPKPLNPHMETGHGLCYPYPLLESIFLEFRNLRTLTAIARGLGDRNPRPQTLNEHSLGGWGGKQAAQAREKGAPRNPHASTEHP